ncbi:cytochrome P450 [Pluteus cervinus]|uniref:Cytochrome P450 n=1 Tax=Pluteus cervinus TaxID=181527 RepID=A0ACD3AGK4_9AGAR|nr:cytochrome P450 [Pluteus cervinus]
MRSLGIYSFLAHTNRLILGFVTLLLLVIYIQNFRARRRANPQNLPYPPGPKPLPILGNIFDLARENEAQSYLKLAHQYGDLVFLTVLGKNILFVNSFQTATELFDKRSSNYSDRNSLPMINEMMGWDWSFGHMPYGERWKTHRRLFHRQFQQSVAHRFWPLQLTEAHDLIRRLLHSPENLIDHLRRSTASMIMNVIYGIHIAPDDDKYINIAEKALEGMAKAAQPGAFLVDLIPWLKYVPAWIPGAGWKRQARDWKTAVLEMRDLPFEYVREALRNGTANPCFVSNLVSEAEAEDSGKVDMETIKGCAGLAYAAGAESNVSALSCFALAMVIHPEAQKKAQEEIDSVIGRGRLPDFNDRCALPYITAIIKEVLRWNPVAPLGLPHMTTNDDEYRGYFIPAGTTVIGNSWAILHDPTTYPEPDKFNPGRFLGVRNGQELSPGDPLSTAFGYGRRICPGRFMAEAQLWISIACILSCFDIGPGADENGEPIKTEARFASGMISHPLPFHFSITPRGDWVKALIDQTIDLAP